MHLNIMNKTLIEKAFNLSIDKNYICFYISLIIVWIECAVLCWFKYGRTVHAVKLM